MASKKDQFLLALLNQIKTFQQAYETVKSLPDAVFEAVYGSMNGNESLPINGTPTFNNGLSNHGDDEDDLSWAKNNKGLVLRIIVSHNSAIQKKEIIKKFRTA